MYQYPYGNAQQLNLDWILGKLKELEDAQGQQITEDLETISNALLSATYSNTNTYNRSDVVFYDGKLYRANVNISTPEAWNFNHWDEIMLGDTVANLVRYVGSLSNNQIFNSSTVYGTHTSDALDNLKNSKIEFYNVGSASGNTRDEAIKNAFRYTNIENVPTVIKFIYSGQWSALVYKYTGGHYGTIMASYSADGGTYFGYMVNDVFTVHKLATNSNDAQNMSSVTGSTVTDALDNLNGAIANAITDRGGITISTIDQIKNLSAGAYQIVSGDTNVFPNAYGVLVIVKGNYYSEALFLPINTTNKNVIYRRGWNNSNNTWYENSWLSDIGEDSLPLSIDKGGTGQTSLQATRNAMGLGNTTGALPVANGGTGQTSLQDTRNAMGLGNTTGALPVANGGTGASTAADARTNLGLCYAANDTFSVTSSLVLCGIISQNQKNIYLDVPLDKSTVNISSVAVTAMTGYIVGINGRIESSSIDFTDASYSASCLQQGDTHIRISISKSNALAFTDSTGDTPVTYFGTLTLKFA